MFGKCECMFREETVEGDEGSEWSFFQGLGLNVQSHDDQFGSRISDIM